MTMTATEVREALEQDGWGISHVWKDTGGWNRPSVATATITRGRASYSTEFTQGAAHRVDRAGKSLINFGLSYSISQYDREQYDRTTKPAPPTLDGVLFCLFSDAGSVRHGQTFEDFVGDFGLDTDSRTAEKWFNACRDTWAALVRLGADFDKLETLFQDY